MSVRQTSLLAALSALLCLAGLPLAVGQDEPDLAARFTLPETDDVAKLSKFLKGLVDFEPQSRDELRMYEKKAPLVMRKTAEKIVALEKDTSSKAHRQARSYLLKAKTKELLASEPSAKALKAHLDEMVSLLGAGDKSAADVGLALGYAVELEYLPAREAAGEAYAKLGKLFADSKDEEVAKRGQMMLGAARRLNLIGQPLELKGTQMDGQPFDIASLKGKVVLVDFWATWCGPCRAEYPNIKKNYDAFKDRGFEVVGVSIDEDRDALEEYLAETKVPWTTLHEKDKAGQHPATVEYGIFGIPSVILIDKMGKVVSTRARGEELGRLLKDLIGEAE